MVALKHVLCPVDLSELSIRALTCAGRISDWYQSQLIVLHVVPAFEPMEVAPAALFDRVQFIYPMTQEQIEERLKDAMRNAGVTADGARVVATAGEPSHVIVNEALATGADLVVVATHGRTGWDRLMLGSVAERVLRRAQCPVLTVPPPAKALADAHTPAQMTIRSVLCPVDFSAAALEAVEFAMDVANRANASVTFLHVIEWLAEEDPRQTSHVAVPEFRQSLLQNAREQLDALVARQQPLERGVKMEVAAGRAHRQIARVASDMKADLIVLGAHGRGGPPLAALGSTSEQVVRAAPCPVLTVRSPGGHAIASRNSHVPDL
jgi:nucleotide-binding universal stress UspA family protein